MTTQLEQAAKDALEALERFEPYFKLQEVMTALRAALEQPAQQWTDETAKVPDHVWEQPAQDEPVAWRWKERINGDFDNWVVTFSEPPPYAVEQQPLYTRPQPVLTSDTSQKPVDETEKYRHEQPCPYVISTREGTHYCSLSQREPLTWQPIETAPRDSKARLVWCPERQNTYAATRYKDGWCIFGGSVLREVPTHWMPLPSPPIEAAHGIGEKK